MKENYQPFDRRSDYEAALRQILGMAQQSVQVFDTDLRYGGWNSKEVADLLQHFLASSGRTGTLSFILHDKDYLQHHCPRLHPVLQQHNHKVRLAITTADAAHLRDSFVLIDGLHSLRRFHSDHDRGALELDSIETASILQQRFVELQEASNPDTLSSPLGL